MTTPAVTPPAALPGSWLEFLRAAIAPFTGAMRVLFSATPLDAARQEKHAWYATYTALGLLMALSIVIILAGDYAPFVNPFDALWTFKFKFFVTTGPDWNVLWQCALSGLTALALAALAAWLTSMQLQDAASPAATPKEVRTLVESAAIGAALAFVMILALVSAVGWLLSYFGVIVFVFGWLAIAGLLALPVITWQARKLFQRTSLPGAAGWLPPIMASTCTVLPCMLAAIFILGCLTDGLSLYGRTVNRMRNTPTVALVQTCTKVSTDVVCALTVFPGKWQDYELIGEWKLGAPVGAPRTHLTHVAWYPPKETDRAFGMVKVESNKDTTIELRSAVSLVCTATGTTIAEDDRIFAVQGRVLGQQPTAPSQMLIRIDNAGGAFDAMLKQACFSKPGP